MFDMIVRIVVENGLDYNDSLNTNDYKLFVTLSIYLSVDLFFFILIVKRRSEYKLTYILAFVEEPYGNVFIR